MIAISHALNGVVLFESKILPDSRGYFLEVCREASLLDLGIEARFVQTNRSFSRAGVLRGLHFQNPTPQGKFVSVPHGEVFDVAVDLRRGSPTFRQWFGETLSSENGRHLWIPVGFAHGFLAITDSVVSYQVTAPYDPKGDASVYYADSEIGIDWPNPAPLVSDKDRHALRLADLNLGRLDW